MLQKLTRSGIRSILNEDQIRRLKSGVYPWIYGNNLPKLAAGFGTDKHGIHFYAQHYQHHFEPIRNKRLNILEIGIGGYDDPRAGGESLRMWKAYFPNAKIFGIDIYDKTFHEEKRIRTFQGSQTDEAFLHDVAGEIGTINIVIDDGSHINEHVIQTFKFLFPKMADDGIYAIEDLQTSYWDQMAGESFGGSPDLDAPFTSMNFLKGLTDCLNYQEFPSADYEPSYFDKNIVSIHFYHNLAFVYKGQNSERSNIIDRTEDVTS